MMLGVELFVSGTSETQSSKKQAERLKSHEGDQMADRHDGQKA